MAEERKELHFTHRWRERGLPSIDPWDVVDYLNEQFFRPDNGDLEFVIPGKVPCTGIYRFFMEGVPFYAVINEHTGFLLTVYTQDRIGKLKASWRRRKRRR